MLSTQIVDIDCPKITSTQVDARREHARVKCNIRALVEFEDLSFAVSVLDLSLGGARLSGKFNAMPGQTMRLRMLTTESVSARIVWTMAPLAGIIFDEPLSSPCALIGGHCLRALKIAGGTIERDPHGRIATCRTWRETQRWALQVTG
jgi:hypothetical protein